MQHTEKTVTFDEMVDELSGLVIDDQRTMRMIVRQMLHQIGIEEITEFPEGKEAWDFLIGLASDMPDFIICDLHMEGMDGLEFVNRIRRSKNEALHDIPVLVLTGDPDHFMHQVADQVGAAKILQKPISAPDLRVELAGILGVQI